MRIAQFKACVYCQAYRERAAVEAGVTDELLSHVERWREAEVFTETERTAPEDTERFVLDSTPIDDGLFERLRSNRTDREIVLLTAAIAKYLAWRRFVQVLDLEQWCEIVPAGQEALSPVFTAS
jgi:AhpD family alkylhydroperoxidase